MRARDSIRHYVGPSVGRSVENHFVGNHFFGRLKMNGDQIWVTAPAQHYTAPAHPHATDAAEYTALFDKNV